jgi:DNA adenine methylase
MSGVIEAIEVVDVRDIEPMPVRIRKMDDAERRLLVLSIKELGYVEPIQVCRYTIETDIVKRPPPFYLIVNGQHRFDVLVKDMGVDKVSVVVLGENWDKVKYWSEAVRLNNIRGEFDVEKLAERIRELRSKIPDWNVIREKLAFTPRDKIFKDALKLLSGINPKVANELREKAKSGSVSIEDISKILGSGLSSGSLENKLIFVSGGDGVVLNIDGGLVKRFKKVVSELGDDFTDYFHGFVEYLESESKWLSGIKVIGVYAGGKANLAQKHLELIPPHNCYVEVFGGMATLLFNKKPSKVEVYNDIWGEVVNFFRVLRDEEKWKILQEKLFLTPYSREEFEFCRDSPDDGIDDIERARRFYVKMMQSFGGKMGTFGCGSSANKPRQFFNKVGRFGFFHERLTNVLIENLDFEELIRKYDAPDTFFYCDPPYMENKAGVDFLRMELEDHKRLVDVLLSIRGKALLCGYDNDVYRVLEDNGWRKLEIVMPTSLTYSKQTGGVRKLRSEYVWLNYEVDGVGRDKRSS